MKKPIKGKEYLCIKTVVMDSKYTAYIKGKVYISEQNGCITNEKDNANHVWTKKGMNKFFTETQETFEITKETIIKYKMKDEFPEVFEVKLEVGKWYRKPNTPFIYHILEIKDKNNIKAYGFDSKGEYSNTNKFDWGTPEDSTKATEQEVFEVLKNEAVKRYNDGGYVKRFNSSLLLKVDSEFKSELKDGDLWYGGGVVFREGKWATIIPTKTKEEAEKLLNCKIIN